MKFFNRQLSLTIAIIFTCHSSALSSERWSRQISRNGPVSQNEWIPIRSGKGVSFGEDLTSAAQTPYQFFAEPSNNNRFNLQQPHSAAPVSDVNGFAVQNSAVPYQFFNSQKQRTVQTFGGPLNGRPAAEALVQNPPPFQYMQEIQRGPNVHHYQSQPIPKSLQNFPQSQPSPQIQQTTNSRVPQFQTLTQSPSYQSVHSTPQSSPSFQLLQNEPKPQSEDQVQLLYVPYDSLYQNKQVGQREPSLNDESRFNILNQPVSASLINDFYSQNEVQELQTKPAQIRRPSPTRSSIVSPSTSSLRPSTLFENTSKPKPHQPPLSMFVAIDGFKGQATEADVLNTLRNSNTIDVRDSVSKNSPKVFIGPSGMDAPEGYSKFDLPYLSNLEGTRHERKIEQLPFFVAPLSYQTPPGFSKIPLPAPHVGSVVVNQPPNSIDSNESSGFTQDNYYTKQPLRFTSQLNPSNANPISKTQKVKLTSGFSYGANGNVELIRNEYSFPTLSPTRGTALPLENQSRLTFTTPRSTLAQTASPSTAETPLTKVSYRELEEKRNYGQSTHTPTTIRTPVTKTTLDNFPSSPRSTTRTPTTKFIELEEHKTVNEEYFDIEKEKSPSLSFSIGSKAEPPSKNFNFRPIPNFDFGSSDYVTTSKKPRTKVTTQAPLSVTQKSVSPFYFPSSTPLPTPSFNYNPTVSVIENTDTFGQVNGGSEGNFFEYRSSPRPSTPDYSYNRFNFENEQTYAQDNSYTPQQYTKEILDDLRSNTEYHEVTTTEIPNYSLPSELPSISPQLPGWINSLMDDKWAQERNTTVETTPLPTTTTPSTTLTTRRSVNRGTRRPITSSNRSTESSVDKKLVTSRRRPTTFSPRNSVSTTEASFPSRSTVSRGSKVKFNASSEDRSRFRTKSRTPVKKEEQNIEYQRDVLNQNYPSIKPSFDVPTTTEKYLEEVLDNQYVVEIPSSQQIVNDYNTPLSSVDVIPLSGNSTFINDNENYSTHNNQPSYYENTIETSTFTTTSTLQEVSLPRNHKNSVISVGLQEPLQKDNNKPNQRLKGNFNFKNRNIDSFYNTNSRDSTTQKPEHNNEDETLITVPTTQATTTPEVILKEASVSKRTNFPRRRLTHTTTESSFSSSDDYKESNGVRPKSRKENVVVVKKIRGRVRQTTTTEVPETTRRNVAVRTRASYNRNANRESTKERETGNEEIKSPRFRIRENTPRFRLETQESQNSWSSRFNQNSFQPIDEEKSKSSRSSEIDDDQEIVTVGPVNEKDIYLFNVTASVVPTNSAIGDNFTNTISTTEKDVVVGKRIKNEDELGSSFEKFVQDVLENIEDEGKSETKLEKKPAGDEKKTGRRGVWKKIKVRPADAFETAETQNIGKRLFNSVDSPEKFDRSDKTVTEKFEEIEPTEIVSTKDTLLEHVFSETTTTLPEVEEPKRGMFYEARRALSELLLSEDDLVDGASANIEKSDEKLEEWRETTQTPTTEEAFTETPTAESSAPIPEKSKSSKQVRTSTSQKVTGEICYRGRCIKTDEK